MEMSYSHVTLRPDKIVKGILLILRWKFNKVFTEVRTAQRCEMFYFEEFSFNIYHALFKREISSPHPCEKGVMQSCRDRREHFQLRFVYIALPWPK